MTSTRGRGDGTAVRLSAPGAVPHDVAHQVAYVVLQIPDDVLDDVSDRDHAHDLARVQHWQMANPTCTRSPTARGSCHASQYAMEDVAFSSTEGDRHLGIRPVSQLNTWPVVSPVNASRLPSRAEPRASLGVGAVG